MLVTNEKGPFVSVPELFTSLINDLVDNGFTDIWNNGVTDITDATAATLEAGPDVDPLNATQPWRIKLDAEVSANGFIVLATPLQLPDDGSVFDKVANEIVAAGTPPTTPENISGFVTNDAIDAIEIGPGAPWSYRYVVTDRGFAFTSWQNANPLEETWNAMCVQRLVDAITGKTFTQSHSPVFSLFTFDGGDTMTKLVARENDVFAPAEQVTASVNTTYNNGVVNIEKQISMSETNQYYITFPAGFNTTRHLYNEEMDIMSYTSGGVIAQYNTAQVNVYGREAIDFTNGNDTTPLVAEDVEIVGLTSGARGKLLEVPTLDSGTWTGGDAAGTFKLYSVEGEFTASEDLQIAGTTIASYVDASQKLLYRSYLGGNANINNAEGMRLLFLSEEDSVIE
jgi:hypothetical protein